MAIPSALEESSRYLICGLWATILEKVAEYNDVLIKGHTKRTPIVISISSVISLDRDVIQLAVGE